VLHYTRLERLASTKALIVGSFVSYEENQVLFSVLLIFTKMVNVSNYVNAMVL
jgi:hypothetical protein